MNKQVQKIVSTSTGRTYKIPKKVTCTSWNLIYCLECSDCGIQYVGQTKNKFLTRFNQHRNDIKHKRDTSVSRHFNKHTNLMKLYVLQLINLDDQKSRDTNEDYWISRLNTLSPLGLNLLDWDMFHSKSGFMSRWPNFYQNWLNYSNFAPWNSAPDGLDEIFTWKFNSKDHREHWH